MDVACPGKPCCPLYTEGNIKQYSAFQNCSPEAHHGGDFRTFEEPSSFRSVWAPGRAFKKPALYILAAIYYNTLSGARRRQDAWLPNGRRWRMKNSIAKSTGVRAG